MQQQDSRISGRVAEEGGARESERVLAMLREQRARAAKRTGQVGANVDVVLRLRLVEEHVVEGDDLHHLDRAHLKDDLDYQWARQMLLKGWLFIHIPLTFSLLVLVALHIFVVYGFRGNLP